MPTTALPTTSGASSYEAAHDGRRGVCERMTASSLGQPRDRRRQAPRTPPAPDVHASVTAATAAGREHGTTWRLSSQITETARSKPSVADRFEDERQQVDGLKGWPDASVS
jgi:hypothetical protein